MHQHPPAVHPVVARRPAHAPAARSQRPGAQPSDSLELQRLQRVWVDHEHLDDVGELVAHSSPQAVADWQGPLVVQRAHALQGVMAGGRAGWNRRVRRQQSSGTSVDSWW